MMVLFLLVFLSYFHITYSAQSVLGECKFKRDVNAVPCHQLVEFMYPILAQMPVDRRPGEDFLFPNIWTRYDRATLNEPRATKGEYICNTIIKNKIDEINTGLVVHPNCQWQQENNQCVGHVNPGDMETILKWDNLCAYRWHQKQTNGNIDEICDECDNDKIGGIQICQFVIDPNIPRMNRQRNQKVNDIYNNIKSEIGETPETRTKRARNQFYNYLECYNRNGFDKFVGWDEEQVRAYQGKYGYTKSGTQHQQIPYFLDDPQTIQSIRLTEQQPAGAASASKGQSQTAASASKKSVNFGEPEEEQPPIIHEVNRRNKFNKDVVLGMIGQFKVDYHTYKGKKDTERCTAFRIGNGWFCTSGHCPTATKFRSNKLPPGNGLFLKNSIDRMFYRDGRHDYRLQELCVSVGFMASGTVSYDFALFKIGGKRAEPGMAIGFNDDAYFRDSETVLFAAGYPGEGLGAEAELRQDTQISIGPFSFANALNQENLGTYHGKIEGELVQDRILQDVTREGEKGESGAPLFGYDGGQNVVYAIVSGPAIYGPPKDIGETFFRFTEIVVFQIQEHCGLKLVDLQVQNCVVQLYDAFTKKLQGIARSNQERIAKATLEAMGNDRRMSDEQKRKCLDEIHDRIGKAQWRGAGTTWGRRRKAKQVILDTIVMTKNRIERRLNSGRIDQDNLYYYDTNKMYPKLEESLIRQEMMEIRKAKQQKQRKRDYFY